MTFSSLLSPSFFFFLVVLLPPFLATRQTTTDGRDKQGQKEKEKATGPNFFFFQTKDKHTTKNTKDSNTKKDKRKKERKTKEREQRRRHKEQRDSKTERVCEERDGGSLESLHGRLGSTQDERAESQWFFWCCCYRPKSQRVTRDNTINTIIADHINESSRKGAGRALDSSRFVVRETWSSSDASGFCTETNRRQDELGPSLQASARQRGPYSHRRLDQGRVERPLTRLSQGTHKAQCAGGISDLQLPQGKVSPDLYCRRHARPSQPSL